MWNLSKYEPNYAAIKNYKFLNTSQRCRKCTFR